MGQVILHRKGPASGPPREEGDAAHHPEHIALTLCSLQVWLKEFDSIYHLLGLVSLPDEDQAADHLADGERVLVAVGDARVGHAGGMKPQEIPVLGKHAPTERQSIRELLL